MAATFARCFAARAIHIKINPIPRSLPERREVLRVLQRFGEVDVFLSLKNDPTQFVSDAFLSILRTPDAAQAAIEASPIQYRLIANPPPPRSNSNDLSSSSPAAAQPSPAAGQEEAKESVFEIHISPSHYRHDLAISTSPLYRAYAPVDPTRSAIAADLHTRIPPSISSAALCDWVTDALGQKTEFAVPPSIDDERDGTVWRGSAKKKTNWSRLATEDNTPWRIKNRTRENREGKIPAVMKSLTEVWNQRLSREQTDIDAPAFPEAGSQTPA